ncbi:hypothetical protein ACS0TY_035986 [Phlomoides rotata]
MVIGREYCDWKARQDVLTIMHLHEKVVDVLNPLARDFKSVGTLKKELAELQDELSQSHNQFPFEEFLVCRRFLSDLKDDSMVPIDCFEEPWVLFRGKDGKPGYVQNTCAHRACPLHLGSVNEGWEYSTDGKCEKMPSTKLVNVKIRALPCFEQDGMVWIWPGDDPPTAELPSL